MRILLQSHLHFEADAASGDYLVALAAPASSSSESADPSYLLEAKKGMSCKMHEEDQLHSPPHQVQSASGMSPDASLPAAPQVHDKHLSELITRKKRLACGMT